MADTVKVKALQEHTAFGKAYKVGDVYEIDAAFAQSVVTQGKAELVDPPAAPAQKPSHPVEPMTTEDLGIKPKARK